MLNLPNAHNRIGHGQRCRTLAHQESIQGLDPVFLEIEFESMVPFFGLVIA